MKTKISFYLVLLLLCISTQLAAQPTGIKIGSTDTIYVGPGTSVGFLDAIELANASKLAIAATGKAYFSNPITVTSNNVVVAGDVEFVSPGQQTMSNFNMTVNNLTIGNGSKLTVSPAKDLTVNGTFTNNASNAGFVIKSTVDGTGSLLHYTSAAPATVERYIEHTNPYEYHMLASPVAAQAISPNFIDASLLKISNIERLGSHDQ